MQLDQREVEKDEMKEHLNEKIDEVQQLMSENEVLKEKY